MFAYRKLIVYKKALQWVLDVYRLCRQFPDYERFALTSQVRRAAVSVTSNIVEGMSRSSNKEIAHFLEISYGSLMEVQSQLEVAQLLNYLRKEELDVIDPKTEEIARMLSGLKTSKMR
jgi:four helix bundle protein